MKYLLGLLLAANVAYANVDVRDYIAECDGYGHDVCFDNAAEAANEQDTFVTIPAGSWVLTRDTIESKWIIHGGAKFINPADWSKGIDNYSYLKGYSLKLGPRFTMGSSDFATAESIRTSVTPGAAADFSVVATRSGAIAAYATTGNKLFSEGNIGVQSYCVNSSPYKQPCYAYYAEAIRHPQAGTTTTMEITSTNYGTWTPSQRVLPSGIYSQEQGLSVGIWLSGAAGNGPYDHLFPKIKSSAGIVTVPGPSGVGFDAGFVCTDASLANSTAKECLRMGVGQQLMWHGPGFNPKGAIKVETGRTIISVWGSSGRVDYEFTPTGIKLPSGTVIN